MIKSIVYIHIERGVIMNKLVIIGNGFDIAHGLPTKYSDFKDYLLSYEQPPQVFMGNFILTDSVQNDQAKHRFHDAKIIVVIYWDMVMKTGEIAQTMIFKL